MRLRLLVRILLNSVLVVAVCEASARIDDWITYRAPLTGNYDDTSLYRYEGSLKFGKPYGRFQKWHLNSIGYRGPELTGNHPRILCLGASETFGMYESENKEYPRQLERMLNAKRRCLQQKIDVVNAAYVGLSLPTATRMVPRIVSVVNPKLALIYPSPMQYANYHRDLGKAQQPAAVPESSGFQFRLLDKVVTVSKEALPPRLMSLAYKGYIALYLFRRGPAVARVPEENIQQFRHDLIALIESLRALDVYPVLITHATRFGSSARTEDEPMLTAWRRFYPKLRPEGFLDMEKRANDVIRSVAAERDTGLIDVAEQMPSGKHFFGDYVHFTDEGAEKFSSLIADRLSSILNRQGCPLHAVSLSYRSTP